MSIEFFRTCPYPLPSSFYLKLITENSNLTLEITDPGEDYSRFWCSKFTTFVVVLRDDEIGIQPSFRLIAFIMQDPTTFHPLKPHFPEQEQLKCPRCESSNTKFCYYNNYNLSQPRHFCKNCRRYWTKGGALRNIPVGGGSRKNAKRPSNTKRLSSSSSSSASTTALQAQNSGHNPNPDRVCNSTMDQERRMLNVPGSFSSLLALNGQYGGFLENLNSNGSDLKMVHMGDFSGNLNTELNSGSDRNLRLEIQSSNNSESYLSLQNGDSSCWSNGNGWPDLAIFTPGSNFP